jgi:hypothetical protein
MGMKVSLRKIGNENAEMCAVIVCPNYENCALIVVQKRNMIPSYYIPALILIHK